MDIVATAHDLFNRGLQTIPLVARDKVPPAGFDLTETMREGRPVKSMRWDPAANIGIVCGPVSDGLCVRDFDVASSYDKWRSDHPQLAERLPTARTARGWHVYARTDVEELAEESGRLISKCGDGEFKVGGYVVAPFSTHPDGPRYEWTVPPDDIPFVSDVRRVGLVPPGVLHKSSSPPDPGCKGVDGGLAPKTDPIEWAVVTSLPAGPGERNRCLFQLARGLLALGCPLSEDELRAAFGEWWRLSKRVVRTKDHATSWRDFRRALRDAHTPKGHCIKTLVANATGDGIDYLESACRELQRHAGEGKPFHLDARTAGSLCGVHYTTAARYLRRLRERDVIRLHRAGNHAKRRANEYVMQTD